MNVFFLGCSNLSLLFRIIEGLLVGVFSGIISSVLVYVFTVVIPLRRLKDSHKEYFRKRFYIFRKRVLELMQIGVSKEFNFTNENIDVILSKVGTGRVTNEMDDDEFRYNELVKCCGGFFEFAKTFVQCVPDVNPSVMNHLEALRYASENLLTGQYTYNNKEYYITFVFDIISGTNYSWHACDIEQCIENLFASPKFELQNWNEKS